MKQRAGFTILEMIIVLSVIALIFLLTLPNIQQKQKNDPDKRLSGFGGSGEQSDFII